MARLSRAEKLLGISSSPVHATVLNSGDEKEFKEEEVWDAQEWAEENNNNNNSTQELSSSSSSHSHESFRFFNNNGRRWLGLEKDPGLSVAFAAADGAAAVAGGGGGGRTLGLSSLSPLKPGTSAGYHHHQAMAGSGHDMTMTTTPGRVATAARMIPPTGRETIGGGSRRPMMIMHQSAPVNVPDWSRIHGAAEKQQKKKAIDWVDDDSVEDPQDEDVEDERLPPHELLAREYARSQATTFSVFEGAGRTLKGRDLSRVRNAVLRKTGFLDF